MTTTTARPGAGSEQSEGSVLVVVPDAVEAERLARLLEDHGHCASTTTDASQAVDSIVRAPHAAIVLDPSLGEIPASELVRVVRAYDVEVPIVVLAEVADPWIGAGVILVAKPVRDEALVKAVARAKHSRHETKRLRRQTSSERPPGSTEEMSAAFARALDEMFIAFQPIVSSPGAVVGYEALMRSREPSMSSPAKILATAERLGRLHQLGQRVRALAAAAFSGAPEDALLFVNLHSSDLLDTALYDGASPLAAHAGRVVLEITERATIEDLDQVPARLSVLRFQGFRIAIDDLGAGYAGLTSFATVEPEFVKLDMGLVRNVHTSPVRRRLVSSVVEACRDLGTRVVAEGIEGQDELRALREIGCELFQGYLIARPSATFERPPALSA